MAKKEDELSSTSLWLLAASSMAAGVLLAELIKSGVTMAQEYIMGSDLPAGDYPTE